MNVSLTSELKNLVNSKVSTGMYNNASEVIREGLRLLDERDKLREAKLFALQEAINEGLASGEPSLLDVEAIIQRGHQRLAAKNK